MKLKSIVMAAAISAVTVMPAAAAMTDADCTAAFKAADTNKDGVLSSGEGARYFAALRIGNKTIADGKIIETDFMTHCKGGLFEARAVEPGAPLKGANSFTEQQAKDRAEAHGLTSVSALKKDADGIWRGKANHNGKTVNVAIDFKGNVVAN